MNDELRAKVEARAYVRDGDCQVMDDYASHEDTFLAGWRACEPHAKAEGRREMLAEALKFLRSGLVTEADLDAAKSLEKHFAADLADEKKGP